MASTPPSFTGLARQTARGGFFDLEALERVSCAMLENGLATPEEIIDACSKCFLDEDKPCREERELIEQSHTLLLGGLAALTIAVPYFKVVSVLRNLFGAVIRGSQGILRQFGFTFSIRTAPADVAAFEAAQAGLTPEYLAAVSKSATILSRLKMAATASTSTEVLLLFAGLTASLSSFVFDAPPSDEPDA